MAGGGHVSFDNYIISGMLSLKYLGDISYPGTH